MSIASDFIRKHEFETENQLLDLLQNEQFTKREIMILHYAFAKGLECAVKYRKLTEQELINVIPRA